MSVCADLSWFRQLAQEVIDNSNKIHYAFHVYLALLLSVTTLASSCVAFNKCPEEDSPSIGQSNVDFDLREELVRSREMPIGSLVADAVFRLADDLCSSRQNPHSPDMAFINAGAIRQYHRCGIRDNLPKGAIFPDDISNLLPFKDDNELVVVKLSGEDIKLALEHAVSSIGRQHANQHSPHFLHVHGLSFQVDCNQAPELLSPDGRRILKQGNRVSNIFVLRRPAEPLNPSEIYNVVMPSYLASGRDGFLAFLIRDQTQRVILDGQSRRPMPKYSVSEDQIHNKDGNTVTSAEALSLWVQKEFGAGRSIVTPESGRITLHASCLGVR